MDDHAKPQASAGTMPEIRVPALPTFAGLVAGLALGLALGGSAVLPRLLAVTGPLGEAWLKALQMTILPLVAGLLFTGVVQTVASAQAGAMARRALGLFAAILLAGGVAAVLLVPALLDLAPIPARAARALGGGGAPASQAVPGLGDFLAAIVPANVLSAASEGAMLPVVVFVALFALASTRIAPAPRRQLALLFEGLAGAMMVVIGWVLAAAPLGVFALALGVAAHSGIAAIGALAHYVVVVSAAGAVVLAGGYLVAVLVARQRLPAFARTMLPVHAVAISTQSSLASLPAMLAACRTLGLREASADFTLPLAVALFRATSPAMNLAVAIYAAKLTGTPVSPAMLAAGLGVAVLVSLSSVSLPGTLSFVASVAPVAMAMGLPIAPLALLVAVEMLPDVMRTLGNVTMDVAVTAAVDRAQGD